MWCNTLTRTQSQIPECVANILSQSHVNENETMMLGRQIIGIIKTLWSGSTRFYTSHTSHRKWHIIKCIRSFRKSVFHIIRKSVHSVFGNVDLFPIPQKLSCWGFTYTYVRTYWTHWMIWFDLLWIKLIEMNASKEIPEQHPMIVYLTGCFRKCENEKFSPHFIDVCNQQSDQ